LKKAHFKFLYLNTIATTGQ